MPVPQNPLYGWNKQPEDHKDLLYSIAKPGMIFAPEAGIDQWIPTAMNQGGQGSCTAHGIIGAVRTCEKKLGIVNPMWSRQGLYYDEREREGSENRDSGAIIRDGFKVINQVGLAPESLWGYDSANLKIKPPAEYYAAAQKNRFKYYASIDNSSIDNIKLCIHHGNPFVFGFDVYGNFESYTSGLLEYPTTRRRLGGHCIFGYRYSDSIGGVKCLNSWDTDWGVDGGSFWISYDYITSNLCDDFWAFRLA